MSIKYEHVIRPPKRFVTLNGKELWRYRDLFLVMSWRDLSVRYKQTALGIIWAVFQPLMTMFVFTFIFNRMANIQSGDKTPYPVFLYIGLVFWLFFSGTLTKASESMVMNANIVSKVYFPRLILPCATIITGLVDLTIGLGVFAVLLACYHYTPHFLGVVLLPILVLVACLNAVGIGLFTSALNIKYRDVRYALPFFIQIMMYVTPVIYPAKMLDSHPWAKAVMLWINPLSGVITTARASLFGTTTVDWSMLGISTFMSLVYFLLGAGYFRATERHFADIV